MPPTIVIDLQVDELPPNPLAERHEPTHRYSVIYKVPGPPQVVTPLKTLVEQAKIDLDENLKANEEVLDVHSIQTTYDFEAEGPYILVRLTFLGKPAPPPPPPLLAWDGWPMGMPT